MNSDKYREYQKMYRLKNREKRKIYDRNRTDTKEKNKKYGLKNKEKISNIKKIYYEKNKELIKLKQKEYRLNNPHVHIEKSSKRRSIKSKQTPKNSNKEFIKQFYKTCNRITKCTGIKFHVDHIISLKNGGDHAEWNLQVIPAKINLIKGCK